MADIKTWIFVVFIAAILLLFAVIYSLLAQLKSYENKICIENISSKKALNNISNDSFKISLPKGLDQNQR